MLKELHNSRSKQFFAENRILTSIRGKYYWVNCQTDVQEGVKRGDLCVSKERPKTKSIPKELHSDQGRNYEGEN